MSYLTRQQKYAIEQKRKLKEREERLKQLTEQLEMINKDEDQPKLPAKKLLKVPAKPKKLSSDECCSQGCMCTCQSHCKQCSVYDGEQCDCGYVPEYEPDTGCITWNKIHAVGSQCCGSLESCAMKNVYVGVVGRCTTEKDCCEIVLGPEFVTAVSMEAAKQKLVIKYLESNKGVDVDTLCPRVSLCNLQ